MRHHKRREHKFSACVFNAPQTACSAAADADCCGTTLNEDDRKRRIPAARGGLAGNKNSPRFSFSAARSARWAAKETRGEPAPAASPRPRRYCARQGAVFGFVSFFDRFDSNLADFLQNSI
ncbi:hypothetical protein EVAR_56559_1 [Eumeta japonica]|uniref:Uncharacterized protein n=1 Tax=Eumeta variegata TaxID=151549 RepID=A0A4C1ZTX4_EUMVA|nr:hypothetical protein EVAR_56559_1 [Eumeta japonica]